jgi:hypothetical protein
LSHWIKPGSFGAGWNFSAPSIIFRLRFDGRSLWCFRGADQRPVRSVHTSSGLFLELDAIAGAVTGGISLRGGVGTVTGALVGAVLLATIDNGMSILNVSAFLQMVVKGFVLPPPSRWIPT